MAFGDCGAGSPEQKPLAHRAFLSRPDFVMIPGDIVYEYGLISEYREKFWPVYNADEPSESGAPLLRSTLFVAAPGNHDTETRDLDKYPDALAYYLLLGPAAERPDRQGRGPVRSAAEGLARRTGRRSPKPPAQAYPRMTNFSFDYGNAHWTIVDSNPYVDWTDPELKDVGRERPGRRQGRHLAIRRLPPPRVQLGPRALRAAADAAPGPGVRGGQGRRRLQRPRPQLPAVVSRSVSSPTSKARSWSAAGTARRSGAGSSTAAGRSTSRSTAAPTPLPTA